MSSAQQNHKKIARNTLMLYIRMLFTMVVGLYTSRVVLEALGVDDYGIYNVVGGFVAMLAYVNSVLTSASQRNLAFYVGKGREDELKRVFCTAINIHLIFALIVLLLAETFGNWFVSHELVIAPDRMLAAQCVFHSAVAMLIVNIAGIPFNASIIAHERMDVFAYISILDVVMKLIIVYALLVVSADKLVVYALLMLLVALLVNGVYIIYCRRKFSECHYSFVIDRSLLREQGSFVGWTSIGTLGFTFKDQALNVIINLFCGTAVNAARGISMQVNGLVTQFSANFLMAVQPQIIKQYAAGELEESRKLVHSSARLAFFLMTVITIPLLLHLPYLLGLWLVSVPRYTCEFLSIILVSTLIATLSAPVTTALQATGNIRTFQLAISTLFLTELPIAYALLSQGYSPYIAVMPCIVTQFLGILIRIFLLSRQVEGYSVGYYFAHIVARSIGVALLAFAICLAIHRQLPDTNIILFLVSTLFYVALTMSLVYTLGVNAAERKMVGAIVKKMMEKLKSH